MAGIVATLLFPGHAWTVMLTAYLAAHLLLAGFICLRCQRGITDGREDPELIGYGAFTTVVSGVVMLENNFDKFIVGTLAGTPSRSACSTWLSCLTASCAPW
ncbi:MAG: hypothetical protein V9F04_05610 [Dermatophilaceae bacterium]